MDMSKDENSKLFEGSAPVCILSEVDPLKEGSNNSGDITCGYAAQARIQPQHLARR